MREVDSSLFPMKILKVKIHSLDMCDSEFDDADRKSCCSITTLRPWLGDQNLFHLCTTFYFMAYDCSEILILNPLFKCAALNLHFIMERFHST